MSSLTICLIVCLVTMVSYIAGKIPMGLTAMLSMAAFVLTGCLDPNTAAGYFGNANGIMMLSMFVVAAGFNRTQFVKKCASSVNRISGGSLTKMMFGYITLIAFLMIAAVIAAVFLKNVPMQFVLCVVPVICCLLLGYSVKDTGDMVIASINNSMKAAGYMCMFAMIYFTMLGKTGMFNTLIKSLIKLFKGNINVYMVMIITSAIAAVSMLTAQVVSAYLIVFPIMLPLYKKMKFDRAAAMIIAQTAIASMCFVPWGIAVVNSSVFAGVDAMELSRRLIPVAACFIPVIILQWIYFGSRHKKQGGAVVIQWSDEEAGAGQAGRDDGLARPKRFWFNLCLFLVVIAMLALNKMPSFMIFMIASFITILADYPNPKDHQKLLGEAGKRFNNTLMMLVGISTFIGVFQGTGMVDALATFVVGSVPVFLTRYIHIVLAAVMVLVIRFMPNKIYNSMYPVLLSIGSKFGLSGPDVLAPFVCNMTLATGSSPFTAATHVGVGLLELDVDDYCKKAVPVQSICNILVILIAIAVGAVR